MANLRAVPSKGDRNRLEPTMPLTVHSGEKGEHMSMADLMPLHFSESPEAELVRQIEILIRKVAANEASPNDIQLLQELQKKRVDMMRPRRMSA
jgi:hypothetical protein